MWNDEVKTAEAHKINMFEQWLQARSEAAYDNYCGKRYEGKRVWRIKNRDDDARRSRRLCEIF